MADQYQSRPFPADGDRDTRRDDSDPLAELARLIGQTDPLSNFGRAGQAVPRREPAQRPQPEPAPEVEEAPAAGPPRWMQRIAREETPPQQEDFFAHSVHPLRRHAATAAP